MEGSYPRPGQKMDFKKTLWISQTHLLLLLQIALGKAPSVGRRRLAGRKYSEIVLIQKSIFCHWARN